MGRQAIFAVLIFGAIQAAGQSARPRQVSEIDLRPLGVAATGKGSTPGLGIEMLFISEDHLVVFSWVGFLHWHPHSGRLTVYDVRTGKQQSTREVNGWGGDNGLTGGSDGAIQRVAEDTFAMGDREGMELCDATLQCQPGIRFRGRFRYSPDGSHVVIGPPLPPNGEPWGDYDRGGKLLGNYDEVPDEDFQSSDTGVYFWLSNGARYYGRGQSTANQLLDCHDAMLVGVIGGGRILCAAHNTPIVADSLGKKLYQLNVKKVSWDASFVSSTDGSRFGLEWSSNTWVQRLEPLACIDECPEAGIDRFAVFSAADGKRLACFEWDPRKSNLDPVPVLSPSGRLAGLVIKNRLMIYSLE